MSLVDPEKDVEKATDHAAGEAVTTFQNLLDVATCFRLVVSLVNGGFVFSLERKPEP